MSDQKVMVENIRVPSDAEIEKMGKLYANFYKYRNQRSGAIKQFQNNDFESYLKISRELFWNSLVTQSEDLSDLDLDFSIGFVRKEVMDFISRITSQNFIPRLNGDDLDIFGVKVLQGIYDKWRFKNNDRVEKFWDLLYGTVNGTVCKYVGYNDSKLTRRYLREYSPEAKNHKIDEKTEYYWNDVWSEIVPLEDIYLAKTYERNIQKQGRIIWKTEMDWKDFKREFKMYDNAEYVYPGNRISEDSLYFNLLSGSGVTTSDKVQLLKQYDVIEDELLISASGIWLNPLPDGKTAAPNPFDHKEMPFVWSVTEPVDEKYAYGLSMPFKLKDPHKILNTSITMLVERELRAIEPPILTSDFEAPKIIFGQNSVIPVNDINAYKELTIQEPSNQFFSMMNSMQSYMSAQAQGGNGQAMPSRQPKSAREQMAIEQMKQQALGNALTMYYDMLRQEIMLMLKTALQFYPTDKYKKENQRILRTIKLPNYPLTTGGSGTMEIRLVRHKTDDINLFWESVNKSLTNGKPTEIIEAPIKVIQNLEFEITSIDIEPEKSNDLKNAAFFEQVIQPMLQIYVPAGIADASKVFIRHMEKLGEHPADYASDKILPALMSTWAETKTFEFPQQQQAAQGATTGALNQSTVGTRYGSQNAGPLPLQQ